MRGQLSHVRPGPTRRGKLDAKPKRFLRRDEFRRALDIERARTDRSEMPFLLVLMEGRSLDCEDFSQRLIDRLLMRIRSIDQLGWFDERRMGVLLPYTAGAAATKIANEIRQIGWPRKLVLTAFNYPGQWLPDEQCGDEVDDDGVEIFTEGIEGVFHNPIPNWKRAIDIFVSAIALVILSPLFAVIALTITIVSPGRVFHKQERIGYQGRLFTLWKFRTMGTDADTAVHREHFKTLLSGNLPLTKLDSKGDPRIIPLGHFLRRCYFDELPQLINVLRGDMSLVGPRPCFGFEAAQYAPWQRMRCDVAPGMTGLWQVSGKNKTTFKEMIRLDVEYVKRRSFALDLKIVLKTFPCIVKGLVESISARSVNRPSCRFGGGL